MRVPPPVTPEQSLNTRRTKLEDQDMATTKREEVCPDESLWSRDTGEDDLPGPDVLPYVDEDMDIKWLTADEWAAVLKKQNPCTSEQTPQQPSNEKAYSPISPTKETKPQVKELATLKPNSPKVKSKMTLSDEPSFKKSKFFKVGRPRNISEETLAQPETWRYIRRVIFGDTSGVPYIQFWDHKTRNDMMTDSELIWTSDHPTAVAKSRREPVQVTVFKHLNSGLWCEVSSTVSPKVLYILDPNFM